MGLRVLSPVSCFCSSLLGVVWFAGTGGREVELEVEITIWCLWCGGKWLPLPLPLPSKTPKWVPPQNLWKWFTSIGTHFFDKYILKSFAYFHLYPHFIIPHTFLSLSSFPHLHTSFLSLLLPSPMDADTHSHRRRRRRSSSAGSDRHPGLSPSQS